MVLDASALIEVLLHPSSQPYVESLVASRTMYAPELLDAEVLSRLVKEQKRGALTGERMGRAIARLLSAPVTRVPHGHLLHDAWQRSSALSAYDALYVALAAQLGVGLVTADRRLANAPKLGVPVTLISTN